MDSKIHDNIVDKLMQYRNKIPKNELVTTFSIVERRLLISEIDKLISAIDRFADLDNRGWIR